MKRALDSTDLNGIVDVTARCQTPAAREHNQQRNNEQHWYAHVQSLMCSRSLRLLRDISNLFQMRIVMRQARNKTRNTIVRDAGTWFVCIFPMRFAGPYVERRQPHAPRLF